MKRVGPAYDPPTPARQRRPPRVPWWKVALGLVATAALGSGILLLADAAGAGLFTGNDEPPRFPEYRTQCDSQTGNRMYWFTGLGQVAVVNDPACPLVLVE